MKKLYIIYEGIAHEVPTLPGMTEYAPYVCITGDAFHITQYGPGCDIPFITCPEISTFLPERIIVCKKCADLCEARRNEKLVQRALGLK